MSEDKFLEKTFKRTSHLAYQRGPGYFISVPETEKPTVRKRIKCIGRKGMQAGDVIDARFPADKRYGAKKVKILYRYYTVNLGFKNYHARVILLDGKNKGKEVSMRVA